MEAAYRIIGLEGENKVSGLRQHGNITTRRIAEVQVVFAKVAGALSKDEKVMAVLLFRRSAYILYY